MGIHRTRPHIIRPVALSDSQQELFTAFCDEQIAWAKSQTTPNDIRKGWQVGYISAIERAKHKLTDWDYPTANC